MTPFGYRRPEGVDDAIEQLDGTHVPYAGGTDLLPRIKLGLDRPDQVLDLKGTGLSDQIVDHGDAVTFGALTTIAAIERSPLVSRRLAALAEAAAQTATPQIRNRATLGGNLAQRPRCWYYRDPHIDCWLKGGDHCPARGGRNEHHAIFDESPCVAVHPSDLAACLTACEATVQLRSSEGTTTIPVADFFAAPTDARRRETILDVDQLISAVRVPAPAGTASTYRKAMDRSAWAFALVGVAVVARFDGSAISHVRVVLSGVANTPHRAAATEDALLGQELDHEVIDHAARAAVAGSTPLAGNRYKQQLVTALIRDAVTALRPRNVPADGDVSEVVA